MPGAVQCRNDASRLVDHRHGDGDDAVGQFVLDSRIAVAAALLDQLLQSFAVGHGARGQRLELCFSKIAIEALAIESGVIGISSAPRDPRPDELNSRSGYGRRTGGGAVTTRAPRERRRGLRRRAASRSARFRGER